MNEIIGRMTPPVNNLTLANTTLVGNYQASSTITAETNVVVNGTATLKTPGTIYLKPGFTASSGCNLTISVGAVTSDKYYYLKDHLGSIRVVVDTVGEIVSYDDYDPWGMILNGRSSNYGFADDKYKFTGKELDTETGYFYFGARDYDGRIGRWNVVDPLDSQRPGLSPYNYCQNNPILRVDLLGMLDEVVAKDEEAKKLISHSLRPDDAKYVRFDENGKIDKTLINQSESNDGNFEALKALVNSVTTYEVSVNNKGFDFKNANGKFDFQSWGQVDSDGGFGGYSLSPGKGSKWNSTNSNFQVIINGNNVNKNFLYSKDYFLAHELYGHAYLHSKGENWEHSDRWPDTNIKLIEKIKARQSNSERNLKLWLK